jgi:arylesterase/paraoxonase
MTFDQPQDFHPHGLSYLQQGNFQYLFTNNHRSDGTHSVEIFRVLNDDQLEHLESIIHPLLTSPNDLVAVGARSFYVTNDGRAHDRFTRSVDTFLGRKTGRVLFYDGRQWITAVDNLDFPNGIALNTNKNQIMVAETLSGYVKTYQMVDNNFMENVDNFYVGVGIDNITLSEKGILTAAVHPNLWALSRHMKNPEKTSYSKVIKIDLDKRSLNPLFQNSGNLISGISVAAEFSGSLYVGAVCDSLLLKVEMIDDE